MTGLQPTDIRVDAVERPLQLRRASPDLSWRAPAGIGRQEAYEIAVEGPDRPIFSTGRVTAGRGSSVPWPAGPLRSRERVELRVRLWGSAGDTDWSDPVPIRAGLLDTDGWRTSFVAPSIAAEPGGARPAFLLRAAFEIPADAIAAFVRVTAHGLYELELNGERVGDEELAPGWTSYLHRLRFQTHDVTDGLVPGTNVLGAWLADGWYRGRLGFNGGLQDNYGRDVALLLQLEVERGDGSTEVVPIEDAWRWAPAPITASGLYEGEHYDARLLPAGWSTSSFDDVGWADPVLLPIDSFPGRLEAPVGPPVRVIERRSPVAVERLGDGRIRYDFGQNLAGRLHLTGAGRRGQRLTLRHAEVLEHGELATRPLRNAAALDSYVFAGSGRESWAPRFTFHGFRYAEIDGWDGDERELDVQAEVLHSAMERSGWFSSSHPLLNQLHENTVWGMRGNFIDLPTDCPQRDERLGWTGDIQTFGPAALYLYDSAPVLKSWLRDLAAEQDDVGNVPNFVPWIACGFPDEPTAAWGDAAVIVPWTIHQRTGDVEVLRDQYPSMRAWVDLEDRLSGADGVWNHGFQLGDWLDPAAPFDNPGESRTDKYLVSTAYFARSAQLLAEVAEVLGETDDAQRYAAMHRRARRGFQNEFVSASGRVVSDSPTGLALAIVFALLEPEQLATAGRRLAELVVEGDHRIQTGFVGTPIICDALAATGSVDTAYHLLLQTEHPSWLYPITMGATTIWERWDSMLPNGDINPGEMTSFNHYALGAVVDFMHRRVAGLAPTAPGYREVLIAPQPGGGLTEAAASHDSPFGRIEVAWRRSGERFALEVVLPPEVTARIVLPGEAGEELRRTGGRHAFTVALRAPEADPPIPERVNPHKPKPVDLVS